MEAEKTTRLEYEQRWWSEWFSRDYSWDQLALKPLYHDSYFGDKTLQEYWRRCPDTGKIRSDATLKRVGELVEFDGRWWHVAHLPIRDRDGEQETWKSDGWHTKWDSVEAIIASRLKFEIDSGASTTSVCLDGLVGRNLNLHLFPNEGAKNFVLRCRNSYLSSINAHGVGNLSIDISGSVFTEFADFSEVVFQEKAKFRRCYFFGRALFVRAHFECFSDFAGSSFYNVVEFSKSIFEKDFEISGWFKSESKANFFGSLFNGAVFFSSRIESPARSFDRAFYLSRFVGPAEFVGAVAPGQAGRLASAFVETIFKDRFIIDDGSDFESEYYYKENMLPEAFRGSNLGYLESLQMGCRTIRMAMKSNGDESREQRYYRFQLSASRYLGGNDSFENFVGGVYGWVSNYGSSFSAPIVALSVLTIFFGLIYSSVGLFGVSRESLIALAFIFSSFLLSALVSEFRSSVGGGVPRQLSKSAAIIICLLALLGAGAFGGGSVWKGQAMALAAVFRPFAALSGDLTGSNLAAQLALRLVTTIQSLLSGVLIFLFGLAVKRRFQIS
jgi:hypothetical protein